MASKRLTSTSNPQIKNVGKLRNRKYRDEKGLTIVEGVREVSRALDARVVFREIYICDELLKESDVKNIKQGKQFKVSRAVFEKISFGNRQEGIIAVCETPQRQLSDIKVSKQSLFVIVDSVEKPGNFGAILRTCDGAGVDAVVCCNSQTDLYNPNVIRASLGTVFTVNVIPATNDAALDFFRSNKLQICVSSPSAEKKHTDVDYQSSLTIVIGSEEEGVSDFWMSNADIKMKIPMKGRADSLNVSASTAILLYEALRQRDED